jgi:toxin ParE1/3/4
VKPYRFHPAADAEFAAAAAYYAQKSPNVGLRFYVAMHELIEEVRTQPTLFRFIMPPCQRHFRLPFPHAVIYVDRSDEIFIVAVSPFKRDPGYWRDRLE